MKYTKRKEFAQSLEEKLNQLRDEQTDLMEQLKRQFNAETFRRLNIINNRIQVTKGRERKSWRQIQLPVHVPGLQTDPED